MTIIYLHGLDADPNANKAIITANHAKALGIDTLRPDLNCPPDEVVAKLLNLIKENPNAVLVGSSLGGYFATLLSDMTGMPCVLLNPSIRPDLSFTRFLTDNFDGQTLTDDTIIYTTTGGWQIRYGDLAWLEKHRLTAKNAHKIKVLLKMGDELLDAHATQAFFESCGADVVAQDRGDHRMSDYDEQVRLVLELVRMFN
ncbi:YqiA/YcfP family alpha/beta fold hydrolase [Moraxella ovis]|uniref:YqiA/YcfP family alpha/beta fold hydrolase n=1 Tax=Moraxella ovis TaxID=29433 RepID=UPI000D9AE0A2|nr:YqiA/YcfP family alpha/beta fold hydrolase [Moraxella ovis]SPX81017.1 esterase YqiA [Moraxella ovis]STZ06005.1 esterase YqiA [Moraxella ovis]